MTDFCEHLSTNMVRYAIENTLNLIKIGYKAAVVCLFHLILCFMNHKHSKPYKALGNYPETVILLFIIFTETAVHFHGYI